MRVGVVWSGVVCLLAALLLVSGGVGSAWATMGHRFVGEFGGFGSADGLFAEGLANGPSGVGVLGSSGDVFTVDAGQGVGARVQRFSGVGVFGSRFAVGSSYNTVGAVAVDPGGAVYVSANRSTSAQDDSPFATVVKLGADGSFAYELDASVSGTTFSNPLFGAAPIAVDPTNGSVFVAATDDVTQLPVIDRFDQSGVFLGSFDGLLGAPDGLGFGCVSGLTVSPSHEVYVFDGCKGSPDPNTGVPRGRVDQYDATTGMWQVPVDDGSLGAISAVAVDPVSGEVYVAKAGVVGSQVAHYTAGGGSLVYTFEAPDVAGIRAMAVGGDGTVYTSDIVRPFVERFGRFAGPTVSTTDPPSAIGPRSTTLDGTINPEGVMASYHFEYGTDGLTYPSHTAEVSAGAGSSPIPVSASVTGLDPNRTYRYRIVGANSVGSIIGSSVPFTTEPAPAGVDGVAPFASVITPRSARIHGSVNPNRASSAHSSGFFATYFLEWGTTSAYGTTVVGADGGTLCFLFVGCDGDDVPVVAQLSGLEPGTTYHFRVVGDNGFGGSQQGTDQTFITSPAAGAGARDVTTQRATLTGTINPHGEPTTYHFNYGPTSSYGLSTREIDGGSGDGDQLVSAAVAGLSADTTYHVQVVATTDGVSKVVRFGGDGLLRTAQAPTAEASGPEGVSSSTAVLVGEVDTHGVTGSYHFDVSSLDSSYSTSTAERPVAGGVSAQRVSAAIGGLPAGEKFVVSLTVTSNDASETSDLATFTTPVLPRVFPTGPTDSNTSAAYGCSAPRLDPYNPKPKPGDTITITGHDLGSGGGVVLGDRPVRPSAWSPSGFKVEIPDDASGTLGLTVNCGHRSNTIAIALFQQPDNRFAVVGRSVTGSVASLTVRVPGPGKIESSATNTQAAKVTIKKAATATVKVKLTEAGVRALRRAKSHRLKITARLRYTPAGGQPAVKTVTITYKAGR